MLADGLPLAASDTGARGALTDDLAVNIVGLVISELVASLNVDALTGGDDAAQAAIWDCWRRSELGATTEGLWIAALVDGQAFAVIDTDPEGRPVAYVQPAWDGTTGIEVVATAPTGALEVVVLHEVETLVRDTRTGALVRLVDWLRDIVGRGRERGPVTYARRQIRTEYARTAAGTCEMRSWARDAVNATWRPVRHDGERWVPDDATEPRAWPHGYPVVAVVTPGGSAARDLAGLQRLINDAAATLATAARVDGLRIGWTRDMAAVRQHGVAADGPLHIQPGAWLTLRSANPDRPGEVGTLPSGDLAGQMDHLRLLVELACLVGRVGTLALPWASRGGAPSGTALRLAMRPHLARVESLQERWAVALTEVYRVWQVMLGLSPVEVLPVWRPVSLTSRREDLDDLLLMQQAGVPMARQAAVLAMTPAETAAWRAERAGTAIMRAAAVQAMAEDRPPSETLAEIRTTAMQALATAATPGAEAQAKVAGSAMQALVEAAGARVEAGDGAAAR